MMRKITDYKTSAEEFLKDCKIDVQKDENRNKIAIFYI